MAQFQTLLLQWFDQHGRKHLPWQLNKTPYRVWVSEMMLQQTQVNTVIPYFERFMHQFPQVSNLADATEDAVLHIWAGLGYYSRARHLHQAAKMVMAQFQGKLPDHLAALQSLPGIGPSTAGAILALAFNQRATILDGNVKRVLARFHAITTPINEKATENQLWALAEKYTPTKRIADYTQAIMDLGATCCSRKQPQCSVCPFTKHCAGHRQGIAEQLPYKNAARPLPVRSATLLILKKGKTLLLEKRPQPGIWGGLWSFPELVGEPDKKQIRAFYQCYCESGKAVAQQLLKPFRHTFTHYHLDIFPVVIEILEILEVDTKKRASSQQIWYNLARPQAIGLPKPVQMIIKMLKK
ncbi:MAG TPA: A/G-specific adenine glycosylase [Gammaproteobacteria bacterium]|nr:A/G-specific adenine glycosylase [Gammaproteobacteria bacterium]